MTVSDPHAGENARPKEHPKWAVRLRWWFWDESPDWLPERVDRAGLRLLCWVFGHYPDRDQCNIPDHDYCVLCMKSMPGKAWNRVHVPGGQP